MNEPVRNEPIMPNRAAQSLLSPKPAGGKGGLKRASSAASLPSWALDASSNVGAEQLIAWEVGLARERSTGHTFAHPPHQGRPVFQGTRSSKPRKKGSSASVPAMTPPIRVVVDEVSVHQCGPVHSQYGIGYGAAAELGASPQPGGGGGVQLAMESGRTSAASTTRQSHHQPRDPLDLVPAPPHADGVPPMSTPMSPADAADHLAELRRAKLELKKSETVIERQRLELESLRGLRSVAVRVAGDEAMRRGSPWRQDEVLRFGAVQRAPAPPPPPSAFFSDELDEVMRQAVAATTRRVTLALHEAARARSDFERADSAALVQLENAFPARLGVEPNPLEQAAKLTTRSLLVQNSRAASRLCAALRKLEEEAANAQTIHVSDSRALAARLVAERDAVTASLRRTLRHVEIDGDVSVASLMEKLRAVESARESEGAHAMSELARLRSDLEETQQLLKNERAGRAQEAASLTATVRSLKEQVGSLGLELAESRRLHKGEVHFLRKELCEEEEMRIGEGYHLARQVILAEGRADETLKQAERRLEAILDSSNAARKELLARLQELNFAKDSLEGKLVNQLRKLEEKRHVQMNMLKTRNLALQHQVLSLKSNTTHGRQKLYWEAIRTGGAVPMPPSLHSQASNTSSSISLVNRASTGSLSPTSPRPASTHRSTSPSQRSPPSTSSLHAWVQSAPILHRHGDDLLAQQGAGQPRV
jgi:hypothetical protein